MSPRLRSGALLRFWRDRRGVSAIEFALIAPVMLVIYFGLIEICQGYMANRRASHTASIVADLVAQADETSTKDLTSVFAIGDMIMRPFSAADLSIRVSSVTMDANGVARIDWSRGNDKALVALTKNSTVSDLPPGLIERGESLILGETEFKYTSAFAQVIKHPIDFKRSYYLRPRTQDRIACTDC
ncbi:TadE/TadG family type IV pilus assembly protein [Brevundimonas sp. NPDC003935]|jgi:Flp pilus assembly protein TadG|uniref:TadE/TadG family type IV pilus assembly protein n=1 Tax=unclassified Brevundimonas TaxID=2622653 RepID=UPI0025C70BD3|nr:MULTISPECIES: TadE/TadG family type IV pilus assembly protein [unclassified Brevundimonas]